MELPKYAVPASLLSPQLVSSSRGDHASREPTNEIDHPDRHGKVSGKRKRTSAGSASLKSISGGIGLPQYTVPESLLPSQTVSSSRGDLTFQVPLNRTIEPSRHDNPVTTSHPEHSIPVHSRSELVHLAPDAHREARNHSSLPPSTNFKQSEEILRTMTPIHQSLEDGSDLAFQTTATGLGIKHDGFLGEWIALYSKGISSDLSEISHDMFFPTPAMTDPWGEAPTPNLSWNSAPDLPFLLDGNMPPAESDAAVAEAAPGRRKHVSDREVPDTHSTVNTAVSLPRGGSQFVTSSLTGARLSHVLKAVAAAGFDSLDDAVVAYYAESLKDDERLQQEQRLSRIRRLPVLLKELHLAAQGWGQWQRRGFQEQIIKSTEDIVIAELKDHLATRRPDKYDSTCSTEQPGRSCRHNSKDETDIEAELPNTWTLLTSLFTKYDAVASKDGQTDVPRLVSKFLAAGTDTGA